LGQISLHSEGKFDPIPDCSRGRQRFSGERRRARLVSVLVSLRFWAWPYLGSLAVTDNPRRRLSIAELVYAVLCQSAIRFFQIQFTATDFSQVGEDQEGKILFFTNELPKTTGEFFIRQTF